MTTTQRLPHWDMTPIYPGLESPEFAQGFANVVQEIADLAQLFDTHAIMGPAATNVDATTTFETIITRYNTVLDAVSTLSAYISCFITTNSQDDVAQARMSELQQSLVLLSQLGTRFTAWIGVL